jgi:hypothetical protein
MKSRVFLVLCCDISVHVSPSFAALLAFQSAPNLSHIRSKDGLERREAPRRRIKLSVNDDAATTANALILSAPSKSTTVNAVIENSATNKDSPKNNAVGVVRQKFLIHKGRSEAMIRRSPCIAGVTLCKGWTPAATETFIRSVNALGKTCDARNIILSYSFIAPPI